MAVKVKKSGVIAVRDLKPGDVARPMSGRPVAEVQHVERTADAIDRLRKAIGEAKLSRKTIQELAAEILSMAYGLECCGREARTVWFVGVKDPMTYPVGDELST